MNLAAHFGKSRLMALGFTALAITTVSAGATSLAWFTDTEDVAGAFTTGTILLDGTAIDGLVLNVPALMPGAVITDDVVVSNIGTGALRYDLTAATTGVAGPQGGLLRSALLLHVKAIDSTTPETPCSDFDGADVMPATALGATTSISLDRPLAVGISETLCFRVTLPGAGTDNTFQGATATATFTFAAEQTANNP
jgi:predicted ribosomally synthesized peptide with SipW-like signal peptide